MCVYLCQDFVLVLHLLPKNNFQAFLLCFLWIIKIALKLPTESIILATALPTVVHGMAEFRTGSLVSNEPLNQTGS